MPTPVSVTENYSLSFARSTWIVMLPPSGVNDRVV